MRATRLAKVAVQAEGLRLQRHVRRTVVQGIYGAIAGVFVIAMLSGLHVAAVIALTDYVRPVYAVLIVAGIDLVIAAILGFLASHSTPDRIEREALEVRERARAQLVEVASVSMLMGPALRLIGARRSAGLAAVALLMRYLGGGRR